MTTLEFIAVELFVIGLMAGYGIVLKSIQLFGKR